MFLTVSALETHISTCDTAASRAYNSSIQLRYCTSTSSALPSISPAALFSRSSTFPFQSAGLLFFVSLLLLPLSFIFVPCIIFFTPPVAFIFFVIIECGSYSLGARALFLSGVQENKRQGTSMTVETSFCCTLVCRGLDNFESGCSL